MTSSLSTLSQLENWLQASPRSLEGLESFRALYGEYNSYVRKTVFYLIGSDDLDDVVQEVFIKVWKTKSKFKKQSDFKTWIYRISINTAYDFLRKHKRHQISFESKDINTFVENNLDIQDLISKGIFLLPEKLRAAFVLFYQEELSVKEVAEVLQINEGTVKSRLANGRKMIVAFFEANGVSYE